MDPVKLKFKSVEDKQKAIEELGDVEDVPAGVALDDKYLAEYDLKLNGLMDSEIDPEFDPAAAPPDPGAEPAATDPPVDPPPGSPPPAPDPLAAATAPLHAEIERVRGENSSIVGEFEQKLAQQKKDFEDKIESLKTPAAPPPEEAPQAGKYASEMSDIEKEIERVDQELNNVPEDEYEKRVKLLAEQTKRNTRMNVLLNKSQMEALKQSTKETADRKAADEKRQNDDARRKQIADEKKRLAETRTNRVKATESFRKESPEFQGKQTYEEMETDYVNFSDQVASRYYNKRADQLLPEQIEIAMQAFQDKSPHLMPKIMDLKEPAEMQKYILLTEIESARLGLQLDKYTGKWFQRKDDAGNKVGLPDMDTAYDYVKKTKGITATHVADMVAKAAAEVKKAMERRTDPGEIDDPHRGEELNDGMTAEVAQKVMEEHDEEKIELMARQAVAAGKPLPREVQYLNRALTFLKLDPITGQVS